MNSNGVLVTAENVENGLKCNCQCPGCGIRLIAKQGPKTVAHFAHASGVECDAGYESSIHLAIKKIIQKLKKITLPECTFYTYSGINNLVHHAYAESDPRKDYQSIEAFDGSNEYGDILSFSHIPARNFAFDKVDLEVSYDGVRPDIVCSAGDKKLFIEVAFTHFVDEDKLQKLRSLGISALEIDVSNFRHSSQSLEELENIILGNGSEKKWLLNARAAALALKDAGPRALKKQVRTEIFQAKQEISRKREEKIKEAFGATHQVTFLHKQRHTIVVKLCKKNISISIKPSNVPCNPRSRMNNLMVEHQGKYSEKYRNWEFKPSLSLFYTLAQSFNKDCNCIKGFHPDDEAEEFFSKVQLKREKMEAENETAQTNQIRSQIVLESASKMSPAMAALHALQASRERSPSSISYLQPQSKEIHVEVQAPNVIVYYSTMEDFLSLPENTEAAWSECTFSQITRTNQNHPGWYYVDFDSNSYFEWLKDQPDSKKLRLIWAKEHVENGWLIP